MSIQEKEAGKGQRYSNMYLIPTFAFLIWNHEEMTRHCLPSHSHEVFSRRKLAEDAELDCSENLPVVLIGKRQRHHQAIFLFQDAMPYREGDTASRL